MPTSSIALKEWAVAVDTLGAGKQIIILRKGGIHREDKDFKMMHPNFLLFPTYEHQKTDLVKPLFRPGFETAFNQISNSNVVTMSKWCKVTDVFELRDSQTLQNLSRFHLWTDGYAQKRLHWRPKNPLTVAFLRVFELLKPLVVPVLDRYNGCKSWVDLGQDLPLGDMTPILPSDEYEQMALVIQESLIGSELTKTPYKAR